MTIASYKDEAYHIIKEKIIRLELLPGEKISTEKRRVVSHKTSKRNFYLQNQHAASSGSKICTRKIRICYCC